MEQILEMIQSLISNLFGSSAMEVVKSVLNQIMEFVMTIFGRLAPAAA